MKPSVRLGENFLLAFTLIIVLLSINQANFHFVLLLSCSKGELFSNLI
jgi:hypothetical protein